MRHRLVLVKVSSNSLVTVRERTRQVGELFGLQTVQRTRLVTAVSEIARNAVQRSGEGTLSLQFDTDSPHCRGQALVAEITDRGPVLVQAGKSGREAVFGNTEGGVTGIPGARKLVDHVSVQTPESGGTVVTVEMALPGSLKMLTVQEINSRVDELLTRKPRTALEELEQQNRDTLQAMEELRREQLALQQADLRKNEFLAILAHELRSPLATLNMTLAILRRKTSITPEEIVQRSDVMSRQIGHVVRLVDDLTDVARADKGKIDLQECPVEVNSLVRDALEMTAAAIEQRRHSVLFVPTPDDVWVKGDPARLLQVVTNVVQNAAKYTPDEGRIEVRVTTDNQRARIEVEDNGVGIDAEMLPQVFGMFVQGRNRSADPSAGLGIGLTLADRLVRSHGGEIHAKSDGPGRGCQFTILLPLMQATSAARATTG